jgi:hypothetical protein
LAVASSQREPEEAGWSFKLTHVSSQILERLNKMCGVGEQMRKKQQRLLKNMDAHKVMLDLLQIPYDKVILTLTSDSPRQSHLESRPSPNCVLVPNAI